MILERVLRKSIFIIYIVKSEKSLWHLVHGTVTIHSVVIVSVMSHSDHG